MNQQEFQEVHQQGLLQMITKLKQLNNGLINQLIESMENNIQHFQAHENWVDQFQYNGQMADYMSDEQPQKCNQQDINEIPEVTFSQIKGRLQINETCSICFRQYQQTQDLDLRELSCHHMFHKQCLDPWLLEKPNCPTCKQHIKQNI